MEDRKGEGRATRLAADAATKVGLARAKDWMPLRVNAVSSLDSVKPWFLRRQHGGACAGSIGLNRASGMSRGTGGDDC